MTLENFLMHLGLGVAVFVLSAFLTWVLMKRVRIIDEPNERSSHTNPTPRSGGIAIVVTFFIGLAALWLLDGFPPLDRGYSWFWAFLVAAFLIAAVSIADDLRGLGFKAKLILQAGCTVFVMALGVVIDQVSLPFFGTWQLGWLAYPLTFAWVVGLTNAFNFMDGIDGIAGGTAAVAAGFFAVMVFQLGGGFLYLVGWVILWASLGFLLWNWQPAKIFMGDSGSQFLGFVLAVLAVAAGRFDNSHLSYYVMPLLFFHFIWDTVYTFFRRWRAGENVTQAHRTHIYQLLNRLGLSHSQVTAWYLGAGVLQGLAALALVHAQAELRVLAFAPFVLLYVLVTRAVVRRARAQGLIA